MEEFTPHQRAVLSAAIGVARATTMHEKTPATNHLLWEALAAPQQETASLVEKLHAEKARIAPNCVYCAAPCGNTNDFDFGELSLYPSPEREAKQALLLRIWQGAQTMSTQPKLDLCQLLFLLALPRSPEQLGELNELLRSCGL